MSWARPGGSGLPGRRRGIRPRHPRRAGGEDFVALVSSAESHRGLLHARFAGAAVLLLRSMGVPARYVSGFVAERCPPPAA
ncbi:MAG: transglutaminase domain-containing protein [Flavonifractor plautii]